MVLSFVQQNTSSIFQLLCTIKQLCWYFKTLWTLHSMAVVLYNKIQPWNFSFYALLNNSVSLWWYFRTFMTFPSMVFALQNKIQVPYFSFNAFLYNYVDNFKALWTFPSMVIAKIHVHRGGGGADCMTSCRRLLNVFVQAQYVSVNSL